MWTDLRYVKHFRNEEYQVNDKKNKSIVNKLTYAYIRKIKKWMYCPSCQKGKMSINKKSTVWTCEDCGYQLSADEFEDDYIFWFCDECNSYLNNQDGFEQKAKKHICRKCGYENDITFDNVKGICTDCGKIIPDSNSSLCVDCRIKRNQQAKEHLKIAGKVVGVVAAAVDAIYLSSQASDTENDENSNYTLIDYENNNEGDDGMNDYPICKTCGAKMTQFDGWAWYTCLECGNSVRIIDGTETWKDEIFSEGIKQHKSGFELADFCRGGDLTED